MEENVSLALKLQFLSEYWLKTAENCQWWRLGMKLIRCCRTKEIKTVHEFVKNVAFYNHSGKLLLQISFEL